MLSIAPPFTRLFLRAFRRSLRPQLCFTLFWVFASAVSGGHLSHLHAKEQAQPAGDLGRSLDLKLRKLAHHSPLEPGESQKLEGVNTDSSDYGSRPADAEAKQLRWNVLDREPRRVVPALGDIQGELFAATGTEQMTIPVENSTRKKATTTKGTGDQTSDGHTSVKAFGAAGDGIKDDTAAIKAAAAAVFAQGGGRLHYPAGTYVISDSIVLQTGVHHVGGGKGVTILKLAPGSNRDLFVTQDFSKLTGVGSVNAAPYSFSVKDMTLDGNYLDLAEDTWRTANTVLNQAGSALRIFGSSFEIDVQIYNVAEHALYSEGIGQYYDNQEHSSTVRIEGRISGREGIIFRGPGDIRIEHVVFGLVGVLPYDQRAAATMQPSLVYPGEPCHGFVLDNNRPYQGHAEIDFVHMYAVSYGYGVKTLGVNRFNAQHVAVDNSLGGFFFSSGTHGMIGIAESRGNGRYPTNFAGTMPVLPDFVIDNGANWGLEGQLRVSRYSPSRDLTGASVQVRGNNNNLRLFYTGQLQRDTTPLTGDFLEITGHNNMIDFTAKRVEGKVVRLTGRANNIRGAVNGVYGGVVLERDASDTTRHHANSVDLVADGLSTTTTGFKAIAFPRSERIRLILSGNAGYTPFAGTTPPPTSGPASWDIQATTDNLLDVKTTDARLETELGVTTTAEQTVTVDHNFLYTPNRNQVSWGLYHAVPSPNAILEYVTLAEITASQLTFKYKWSSRPTTDRSPVLTIRIQ